MNELTLVHRIIICRHINDLDVTCYYFQLRKPIFPNIVAVSKHSPLYTYMYVKHINHRGNCENWLLKLVKEINSTWHQY